VKSHGLSANLSRYFLVFGVALLAGACGGGTDNGGTGGSQAAGGHGGSASGTGGGAGTGQAGTTGSGGAGTTGTAGTGGSASGTGGTTGTAGGGGNTGAAGAGGMAGATGGRGGSSAGAGGATGGGGAGGAGSGGRGGNGNGGRGGQSGNAGQSGSGGAGGASGHGGTTGSGGSGGGNVDGGVVVQDGATTTGGAFVRTAWTATYTCTGTCPAQGSADTADADTKRAFDGNRTTRWSTGQYQQSTALMSKFPLYFTVDMKEVVNVSRITLDAGTQDTYDAPGQMDVLLSVDGTTYTTVVAAHKPVSPSNGMTDTITLPQQTPARYIQLKATMTIKQVNSALGDRYWAIGEMNVYP
jgi:hypothetical protein